MIHQFIFAAPKPGMSEADFQHYWVDQHAVNYASKIKQIRKYIVDTRVAAPWDQGEPMFGGIAEIWIRPEDQIPSLQSPEFLDGARLDEPRWAAFWKTLVLDTNEYVFKDAAEKRETQPWIKSVLLLKRKEGMPLAEFREYARKVYAPKVARLPGLARYLHCQTVDGAYGLGEARYDAVDVMSFPDVETLAQCLDGQYQAMSLLGELGQFVQLGYLFQMTVRENWVIGPVPRD